MLYGVDVSAYQPDLDFAAVPMDFVIIKATGGPGYTNPLFRAQDDAARVSGVQRRGFYHFSGDGWTGTSAAEEANHFINTVADRQAGHALVLDWEAPGPISNPGWALEWLRRVEAAFGRKPWIYANGQALGYDMGPIAREGFPLWHAYYSDRPVSGYTPDMARPAAPHWGAGRMWQFTQYGRLPGYGGSLDLNLFYGDAAEWDRLAGQSRPLLLDGVAELYRD